LNALFDLGQVALIYRPEQFGQLSQFFLRILDYHYSLEFLALLLGCEGLQLAAFNADAL
jgi:hypothetical protein